MKVGSSQGTAVPSEAEVCQLYIPLVENMVRRLHVPDALRDDARQEGCIGLIQAVRRYDANSPVHFSVFARPYVRGAILRRIYTRTQVTETSAEDPYAGHPSAEAGVEMEPAVLEGVQIEAWLGSLSLAEYWVLRRIYWDDAATQQIAAEIGVSRRRVNQIHNKLLRQGAESLGGGGRWSR